jgi:hypothetical protein
VSVEIVVRGPENDWHVDFKQSLAKRISFFDVSDIHLAHPLFRQGEGGPEIVLGAKCCSRPRCGLCSDEGSGRFPCQTKGEHGLVMLRGGD